MALEKHDKISFGKYFNATYVLQLIVRVCESSSLQILIITFLSFYLQI